MNKKRIYLIFTIIALLIVGSFSMENSHSAPNAFDFCSKMGTNMNRNTVKNGMLNGIVNPDEPNRKWTVEELFRKSAVFTTYNGEGEGDWIFADKVDRGLDRVGEENWNATGVQDNLKYARKSCLVNGPSTGISNVGFAIAGGIANLINMSVGLLVGKEDFLTGGLVEIIGGSGDANAGLIGTMLNSIYMPLVVITALIMAVTIIYKGLIQMKMREALSSIIWSGGAFIIGVALMLNPVLLAETPQKITSTITTCVVGALSGQNCLTNTVTTPSLLAGTECRSDFSGNPTSVDMVVNGMNCTIWKTFVMEPWAEEQFGIPYSKLYTKNPPLGGEIWEGLSEDDEDKYCVHLASTKSVNESKGNIIMDHPDSDSTVCNVALYQLYLTTEMDDLINHPNDQYKLTPSGNDGDPYDARWFDIIVPMAQDSSNWKNWSGNGRFMARGFTSFMSFLSILLAGWILFPLSILSAAYKATGVIMMAFAPVFFLIAMEPNRGRKIFLGWMETLISSILKYFAITMMIIVALVLYSGVLSHVTGAASIVSVIVLTFALSMYRKELINIIGASNMGGQRLTNRFGEKINKTKDNTKTGLKTMAGGAIGAGVVGRSEHLKDVNRRKENLQYLQKQLSNPDITEGEAEKIKDEIESENKILRTDKKMPSRVVGNMLDTTKATAKNAVSGGNKSLKRSLQRGTGTAATVFKQMESSKRDNKAAYENALKTREKGTFESSRTEDINDLTTPTGRINAYQKELTPSVENQRKDVEYGNVKKERSDKLDKLTAELSMVSTSTLVTVADKIATEQGSDTIEAEIARNEIEARIKVNTLTNQPSGELSRSLLTNNEYVSNEELELNFKVHKENFLETGSKRDQTKLGELSLELSERKIPGFENETERTEQLKSIVVEKHELEKLGIKHVRNENVPTEEELNQKSEKYIRTEKVIAPDKLKKEEDIRTNKLKDKIEIEQKAEKRSENETEDKYEGTKERRKRSNKKEEGDETKKETHTYNEEEEYEEEEIEKTEEEEI